MKCIILILAQNANTVNTLGEFYMHIKEKIQKCLPALGGHVHLSDTCITEIFASFDYDYIWVDMEHTTLSPEQVRSHIMAAKAS